MGARYLQSTLILASLAVYQKTYAFQPPTQHANKIARIPCPPPPPTRTTLHLDFPKLPDFGRPKTASTGSVVAEIDDLEKEVYASARVKMDKSQLERALLETFDNDETVSTTTTTTIVDPQRTALLASPWQVSLAAASAVSTFVLVTTNASLTIAGIVFMVVFVVANGDPLDEENPTGAVARQVGRMTIQSVESSKPKLKAIARAAITDQEEIILLKQQVKRLEKDNAELTLWKKRRVAVDENLSRYTQEELKDVARSNRLAVGGTKSQLMMRILEAGVELELTVNE
ncbi:hypothetical protein IV203_026374 [Nitzschia inconspicua]|uniref:SAP domain-containing protein n=1 Tax=Nitzschia inconspicua TaxID=303405 RepID=A0A9K3PZW5_9STRA|nr:hypothetical protein IV203_026374 [Nitzschia inconspicua]